MEFSLLFRPYEFIERAAAKIQRTRRLKKLANTVARDLKTGHIDSLEFLELIKKDGLENPVIYDIGAHIGTWSLLAKAIFPSAKIHAFEPFKNHIDRFNDNLKEVADITIHPYALGSSAERSKINVATYSDSSSILPLAELMNEEYKIQTIDQVDIEVVPLDDLVEQQQLPQANIMKLDVQGYELEALKGGIQQLKKTKYVIMEVSFLEYYQGQPLFEDVIAFMKQYHFQTRAFGANTPSGKNLSQIDILFVNQNL